MALEKKDVEHIATLCNLTLSPQEVVDLSKILTDTLDYIQVLNELSTQAVSETYQVTGLVNIFKDDAQVEATLERSQALANAKEVSEDKFATKAVFNRDQ